MRLVTSFALVLIAACGPKDTIPGGGHPADPAATPPAAGDNTQAIAEAEKAAFARAEPVLTRHCAGCHTTGGAKASKEALEHFSMDSYPFGGHHATEIGATIRVVLGVEGGKPATMPHDKPGAVQGDELAAVVEWSRAFDRSHAAGLHHHGEHGEHEHEHGAH